MFRGGIGLSGVLGHPDLEIRLDSGDLPLLVILHFVFGGIEHAFVAPFFDLLQECNGIVGPFPFADAVLAAVRLAEILAVISYRVGDGIGRDEICHPVRFFDGFLFGNGGGEEVGAQLDAVFGRFLKVVPGIGVGYDFSGLLRAVAHPDHGKFHTGLGNLGPIHGALILGNVNAEGLAFRFLDFFAAQPTENLVPEAGIFFFGGFLRFVCFCGCRSTGGLRGGLAAAAGCQGQYDAQQDQQNHKKHQNRRQPETVPDSSSSSGHRATFFL